MSKFNFFIILGSDQAFPACVVNGVGITKTFQILYRNEEVTLDDSVMFRVHILVDSHKVSLQPKYLVFKPVKVMTISHLVTPLIIFSHYF